MKKFNAVYIYILGNKPGERIGLVKYGETGYYSTDCDNASMSIDEVKEHVAWLNSRLEVPEDVVDSMRFASMFGWGVPVADRAHHYYKEP